MRFPSKREWAALVILYRRGPRLNLGEAIEVVRRELCTTKRTARRIIKRLARLRLVKIHVRDTLITVEASNPAEALEALAGLYAARRRERCNPSHQP